MPTGIQWTDETWNPTTGCTKISSGCKHCYAERMTERLQGMGVAKYAAGFSKVVCHPDTLKIPLRWKKPRRVFVDSMSDLFHEDVPNEFLDKVFAVMALTPQYTYQVLTKRPERMKDYLSDNATKRRMIDLFTICHVTGNTTIPENWGHAPLPNVWLGTTVENADYVHRVEHLRQTPAAVRFLSCEPLLGPIPRLPLDDIDQVIIGGESGQDRRPCKLEWVLDIVEQCDAAGVAPFVKQLDALRCRCGRVHMVGTIPGTLDWSDTCRHCRLHESRMKPFVSKDPTEWPAWARRREFPKVKESES